MFLNGIKYQVKGDSATFAFKFNQGSGRFRNAQLHFVEDESDYFNDALTFALSGNAVDTIEAVILYLADSNGDQWQVERKGGKSRFTKNRQLVEKGEEAFSEAFKEGDEDSPLFDFIELSLSTTQLIGRRKQNLSPFLRQFNLLGEERVERLKLDACSLVGLDKNLPLRDLWNFVEQAKPINTRWNESSRHLNLLIRNFSELRSIDPKKIDKLEQEVEVLRKLEAASGFLNDPSQSFDVLKGKLKRVDGQLTELCDKSSLDEFPTVGEDVNWDSIIASLSRLQALERLEKAYDQSLRHLDQMVKPIFKDHLATMKSFLVEDKMLLGDIELALQTLTQACQSISDENKVSPENPAGIFKKIFRYKETEDVVSHVDSTVLEKSRAAVDQVLRSLGAMASNLELASANLTEGTDSLQGRYERVVKELSKEKEVWHRLAKKYQLDPKLKLKSMLNFINNLGKISLLSAKQKELKEKLMSFRQSLKSVEALVLEWRVVTGSQKAGDLDQAAILISEAKNLLQYHKKKEVQLKKAKKLRHRVDFFRSLRHEYSKVIESCEVSWKEICERIGLRNFDIGDGNCQQFFRLVEKSQACSEVVYSNCRSKMIGKGIFELSNLSSVFSIFDLQKNDALGRETLLESLSTLSPHCSILITLYDPELSQILLEEGFSGSSRIRVDKAGGKQIPSVKNKTAPDQDISDKARAALELFKGRSSRVER